MLTTCAESTSALSGRDPQVVLDTIERGGFAVTAVDFVKLPYSFGLHGYSYHRTTWNTFVVAARKVRLDHRQCGSLPR